MGQRTFILLKKNYKNNNGEWASRVSLIHHQWGIGRVMQGLLMQEALKTQFPLDRSLQSVYFNTTETIEGDDGYLMQPISMFYNFSPLSNLRCNYHLYDNSRTTADDLGLLLVKDRKEVKYFDENNKTLKTSILDEDSAHVIFDYPCRYDYNIFDIKNIQAYYSLTDNNNGCMIVEVTQQYCGGRAESIVSQAFKVKVGFCTGSEEEDFYHEAIRGSSERFCYNPSFSTLCSPLFYATETWGGNEKIIKSFVRGFVNICKQCDIEFVYDKAKEEEIKQT